MSKQSSMVWTDYKENFHYRSDYLEKFIVYYYPVVVDLAGYQVNLDAPKIG